MEERELEEVIYPFAQPVEERERELEEVLSLCTVNGGERTGRSTIPLHNQRRRENWKRYYSFAQAVERELEEVLSLCTISGEKELEEVLSLCTVNGGESWKRCYPFA